MEHWSKTPPTRRDVEESFNGFFWIRYCIVPEHMDAEGIWPEVNMVEPVQIFFVVEKGDNLLKLDKMCVRPTNGGKALFLDNKEHMKGIEWQLIEPPKGVEPNDL